MGLLGPLPPTTNRVHAVVERRVEDLEVDRLPSLIGRAVGIDTGPRGVAEEMLVPASAAFVTGALFSLPRAREHCGGAWLGGSELSLDARVLRLRLSQSAC